MEPNTSPEQQMREIFASTIRSLSDMRDTVISTVVSHSQTARELGELKTKFDEMSQRMTSLIDEAQRVRQDLSLVISERDKYKKEAEEGHALATIFEKERDEARLAGRELQTKLDGVNQGLAESERRNQELSGSNTRLHSDLDWTKRERDNWSNNARENAKKLGEAEQALKVVQEKLERLQGVMRDIFPVAEVKPVEIPGEAPSFRPVEVNQSKPVEVLPHPVQSAGEGQAEEVKGVNERIDEPQAHDEPWWRKHQA